MDVPQIDGCSAFTRYFGGSAVYGVTPTDEATVMTYLRWNKPRPVTAYLPSAATRLNEEADEGYGDDGTPV